MSLHRWLHRREYGLPNNYGDTDSIMKRVYSSIDDFKDWTDQTSEYGAIYNLEFSPEGNILVAACEKKSILLFDAITQNLTHTLPDAHSDSVNCIKFLDERMFATCSDDTTVALWDLRFLKTKVRSLHGHSNWVKNIEYSSKDKLLVTSGFDGSIFTWDINSQTEQGLIYQKVFHTSGLMRCRISPDCTKLIICSTGGYLMIIHNLDLTTLHKDLNGFRPSIYRLMQMGHQYIPQAAKFDHVFSRKQKKNRVELVTDFPDENDAEVVLALQIDPQGNAILSRNISYDEKTEWSCIHDINEEPGDITERIDKEHISSKRKRKLLCDTDEDEESRNGIDSESGNDSADEVVFSVQRRQRNTRHRLMNRGAPPPPPPPRSSSSLQEQLQPQPIVNLTDSFVPDIWAAEVTVQDRAMRQNRARNSNSVTGYNYVYAISSGVLPAAAAAAATSSTNSNGSSSNAATTTTSRRRRLAEASSARSSSSNRTNSPPSSTSSSDSPPPYLNFERIRVHPLTKPSKKNIFQRERKIFQNPKKLMFYIQEPNKSRGFIKEPSFSADGRIICSPYGNGVRLLSYTDSCSVYPQYGQEIENIKRQPRQLHVLKELKSHNDIVLSTRLSPREPLLVTGCKTGNVIWYHPIL